MIYNRHTRRAFLKGTGGILFSIPLLPSLAEKAYAQTATKNVRRLVTLFFNAGSGQFVWFPNVPGSLMTTTGPNYKAMRNADIWARNGQISPIFKDSRLARYANQLNLYRGVDIPSFSGHTKTGAFAGESVGDRTVDATPQYPSIDYIASRSNIVYPNEPSNRLTVLGVLDSTNNWNGPSTSFSKSSTGAIEAIHPITSPIAAFDHFFKDLVLSGGGSDEALAKLQLKRKSVLDTVLEDYRRVMGSGRLASSERQILESHVDKFRDLERKIANVRISACDSLGPKPTTSMFKSRPESVIAGYFPVASDLPLAQDLMIEISATAMRCQLTNVISIMLDAGNLGFSHLGIPAGHGLSHMRVSPDPATRKQANDFTAALQSIYVSKVMDLVERLDIDDPAAPGEKMLDNTLIIGSNEMGTVGNHRDWSLPLFTLGGGTRLNTGWYVDYRSKNEISSGYCDSDITGVPEFHGRDYNSFLIGAMLSMGLKPSDWEQGGVPGFGSYRFKKTWYVETTNPTKGIITPGKRSAPPFMLKS